MRCEDGKGPAPSGPAPAREGEERGTLPAGGRILTVEAGRGDIGQTVGSLIRNRLHISRSLLSRLKFNDGIFLNGRPVGSFQRKRMDTDRKCCEFGIILQNDAVKNQGIGTEAIRLGLDLAVRQYGMKTITGDTMGRNKRMIRVFEKLGFEHTETVKGAFELPDGKHEDRLVFCKRMTEDEQ